MLNPYAKKLLNRAEVVSLSATSVTLYLCSFLVQGRVTASPAQVALTAAVLGLNLGVMAWFAAIITHVGTESFLKFIGAMDQHEKHVWCHCYPGNQSPCWVGKRQFTSCADEPETHKSCSTTSVGVSISTLDRSSEQNI